MTAASIPLQLQMILGLGLVFTGLSFTYPKAPFVNPSPSSSRCRGRWQRLYGPAQYTPRSPLTMSIEDGMELDGDIVDSLYDLTEDTPDIVEEEEEEDEQPKKKKRKTSQRVPNENDWYFDKLYLAENETDVEQVATTEWSPPASFYDSETPELEKFPYVAMWVDADLGLGEAPKETRTTFDAHTNHVAWARELSRDKNSGVMFDWSHQLLSEDLSEEAGTMVCVRVNTNKIQDSSAGGSNYERFEEVLKNEPQLASSFNSNVDLKKLKIFRWKRVTTEPLLNVDDGKVLDLETLYDEHEDDYKGEMYSGKKELVPDLPTSLPTAILCFDKTSGVDGVRASTRPSHLEYLKNSGRVISAGPIFSVDATDDEKPIGSLVLANVEGVQGGRDFAANDPYALAELFEEVYVARYNKADVSGKYNAPNKYDPNAIDVVNHKIGLEGDERFLEEDTPWLV
ncbi:hypothetical protein TrLO_g4889 [Triparma laevis f. longispina]|uniref:YCII-related domain-containing protein n=1 Tax=Triparma laevis f. longispina TaxID=1714387 RepID=A0A9W7FKZ9_9STRA|nr:hypothetical protein TrLO_g4889 [Triparma laevis f. longispina]